ncbi:Fc.00g098250.m01.CDS01 [Cosmosporella sp. VM-42]
MVRESGISATKPIFSTYLLSTFKLPFRRRHSEDSSSSFSGDSPTSSAATTPANSPPNDGPLAKSNNSRLSRVAPNTLRCSTCSADLAFSSQIISKGFTGRYGRAFLVAPPPPPAQQTLLNIRVGRSEDRQLVTGWHTVADITCGTCASKLGWKYVDARETAQKYKVGKFILETERVVTFRSWEDAKEQEMGHVDEQERSEGEDEVVFDSDDEDECEDVFAGTWDAETVAKRRTKLVAQRKQVAKDTT